MMTRPAREAQYDCPALKFSRTAKLIGLDLRSVGALSDNLDRSSEEAVEFSNPPGRQVPRTAALRFPEFHEVATEHVEAPDSNAIRLFEYRSTLIGFVVPVVHHDGQRRTINWRQCAESGCFDPRQSGG